MRGAHSDRAMVLLGVMIVIAMAALAGTTAMYLAQAELASSRTALRRTQSRAMAWSGVQAVMAEMADQREKLLDGAAPELTKRWELFAEDGGPRGVVRLVAWAEDGPLAQSECAKLDLNSATAEMLGKIGLDEKTAAAVVAARDKTKFASVGDLTRVEGFDAHLLERADLSDGAATSGGRQGGPASAGGAAGAAPGALADLVTVFSFDPNIQSGLGDNGSDHRGKLRVNLQTAWSDRLAGAIDERFGSGSSASLESFFDRGVKFKSLGDVAAAAGQVGLPVAGWPPVFDALTITDDPFLIGRIDLNRATAQVLACIPGVSQSAADQIVEMRDKVDADAKRSVCWPLVQGIVKTEEFAKAVDYLSTRSMQWRVRVEAGLAPSGSGEQSERADEVLKDRVVLEAVVDVASERPRVAYLRDVTLEKAMASVYAAARPVDPSDEPPAPVPAAPTGAAGAAAATGAAAGSGLHMDTDLNMSTDLDLSSGMDKGFGDLKLGSADAVNPIETGAQGPSGVTGGSSSPAPDPGVDRRVGRWTTGPKGAGG